MFTFVYWVACLLLYIIALPILLILPFLKAKYKDSLKARFFLYKNTKFSGEVWIHACSLGEINSLQIILQNMSCQIILSTITNTGFKRAKELFSTYDNIKICYLPFEIFLPFLMPKNLKKLVVLEAELWYILFYTAKIRGAKTILLNARISNKSYPKYKKTTFFYKFLFKQVDLILCQQDEDKDRLQSLGAGEIITIGNIKALNKIKISKNLQKPPKTLLIAASTHNSEEKLIIECFLESFRDKLDSICLLVIPRHPERFSEVWNLILSYNLKCQKFSIDGLNYDNNIILIDVLGELINFYNIADCVILGGSFVRLGGHNPLECAFFNTKLISGIHIFNQLSLFSLVDGYKIVKSTELTDTLKNMQSLPNSKIIDTKLAFMQGFIKKYILE